MFGRIALASMLGCLAVPAFADDEDVFGHSWQVKVGPVFGQPIIGSEDTRRGQVYYVGRSFYSRRLSTEHVPGQLVTELFYNNTIGGGFEDIPVNLLHVFGYSVGVRLYPTWIPRHKVYVQGGLGISYADQTTRDIDSHFNTTPYLAIGTTWQMARGRQERWLFEIRFFHLSNAGTAGHNQGTNQLQYLLGVQF